MSIQKSMFEQHTLPSILRNNLHASEEENDNVLDILEELYLDESDDGYSD